MKKESSFNEGSVEFNVILLNKLVDLVETTTLFVEDGKIYYECNDEQIPQLV